MSNVIFCRMESDLKGVCALPNRKQGRKSAKKKRSSMKKTLVLFGVAMVALTAVFLAPSPYEDPEGGIVLCGEDLEAEVFGPALPENIVGGYTEPVIQSVVLPEKTEEEDATTYVYASEYQDNYHLGTCQFAYASGSKLTVYEAYFLGYSPGRCCGAPAYTGSAVN